MRHSRLAFAVFDTLHIDLTRQGRSAGAMLILDGPDVADQGESIMSCRSSPMRPTILERDLRGPSKAHVNELSYFRETVENS